MGAEARAEPIDPRPPTLETGIHGLQRPRSWDATVTAEADGIDGDEATFVALPDGTLLVEQGPDSSLEPLAAAVEQELRPPYRARAVRQGDDAVGGAGAADRGAGAPRTLPAATRSRSRTPPTARRSRDRRRRGPSARCRPSRRGERGRGANTPSAPNGSTATSGRSGPPASDRYPSPMVQQLGSFEKVLRVGEGRRLKRLAEQAAYIGTLEPEFEKLSGRRARREDGRVPAAVRERREPRRAPVRGVRGRARGVQADDGRPPLRRAADGRHRPPRGRHRRDEDRRGQDVRRRRRRST